MRRPAVDENETEPDEKPLNEAEDAEKTVTLSRRLERLEARMPVPQLIDVISANAEFFVRVFERVKRNNYLRNEEKINEPRCTGYLVFQFVIVHRLYALLQPLLWRHYDANSIKQTGYIRMGHLSLF